MYSLRFLNIAPKTIYISTIHTNHIRLFWTYHIYIGTESQLRIRILWQFYSIDYLQSWMRIMRSSQRYQWDIWLKLVLNFSVWLIVFKWKLFTVYTDFIPGNRGVIHTSFALAFCVNFLCFLVERVGIGFNHDVVGLPGYNYWGGVDSLLENRVGVVQGEHASHGRGCKLLYLWCNIVRHSLEWPEKHMEIE